MTADQARYLITRFAPEFEEEGLINTFDATINSGISIIDAFLEVCEVVANWEKS